MTAMALLLCSAQLAGGIDDASIPPGLATMLGGNEYMVRVLLPDGSTNHVYDLMDFTDQLVIRTSIQKISTSGASVHQFHVVSEPDSNGFARVDLHLGPGDFEGHVLPCVLQMQGAKFENGTLIHFQLSCTWCLQDVCARPTTFLSGPTGYALQFDHLSGLKSEELPDVSELQGSAPREWDEPPEDYYEMKRLFVANATTVAEKTCAAPSADSSASRCERVVHVFRSGGGINGSFTTIAIDICQAQQQVFSVIAAGLAQSESGKESAVESGQESGKEKGEVNGKLYRLPDCVEVVDQLTICDGDRLMAVHHLEPFMWPPLYPGHQHNVPAMSLTTFEAIAAAGHLASPAAVALAVARAEEADDLSSPLVLEALSTAPKMFRVRNLLTAAGAVQYTLNTALILLYSLLLQV
jgi:hypothetical protein